jgi:hypothetical protein
LLAGLDAGDDFRANRLVFDALDEIAGALKFASASCNAMLTSRRESPALASEILPRPRRLRKAFWSLVLKKSNIRPA